MALAWDFTREIDSNAAGPGMTTSFFTTEAQAFYLKDSEIYMQEGTVVEGQWQDVEYADSYDDEVSVSDPDHAALSLEHLYNGAIYGSAHFDSQTVFFMYLYMFDASDWVEDGYWVEQPDNPIKAGQLTLVNTDPDMFIDIDSTIFAPGIEVRLRIRMGDSDYYDIGMFHLYRAPYDITAPYIELQGKNKIGYYLADQTFDELTDMNDTYTNIVKAIFEHAGLEETDYVIEEVAYEAEYTFESDQVLMDGLENFLISIGWVIDDIPDGTIIVGSPTFMRDYKLTAVYEFDRENECITYPHKRDIDGVFNRVCVSRREFTKDDIVTPARAVYEDIPYFDSWYLGPHRTYHYRVDDEVTDTMMDELAVALASELQYSGVVETVTTMLRPWLQIGDVGVVTESGTERLAGIITSIEHMFGRSGFFTEFTITSGGEVSNPDNPATIAVKYAGRLGGANREKRILDYISGGYGGTAVSGVLGSGGGRDGVNGLSAYQIWLALGNTGTEADFIAYLQATGTAAGGTTGQMLVKKTDADYDTEWVDAPEDEVPDGGFEGQVLTKLSDYDEDLGWVDPPEGIPAGGLTGQVLVKKSDADYDVEWKDVEDLIY